MAGGGLPPPPTRAGAGDFAWTSWYNQLYTLLNTQGSVSWDLVNKAGSSIANLQNKNHGLLTNILGTGQYHISSDEAANVTALPNISGNAANVTGIVAVANGGTGVTASSGANSVVLRDTNQNIVANSISEGYSNVAAAGTTTVLTVASVPNYVVTGSGGQTYQLPDATTLPNGIDYTFNNNQSSGTIVVKNNSSTTIATIQSGGFVDVSLLSNSTAAGSWDVHNFAPSNVSWSTNTLDYAGSITSATWNGVAVAINRGGTSATTQQAAINNLTGAVTSGYYPRGNGTNVIMSAIQAADVPTLNQNTTGTAANITASSNSTLTTLSALSLPGSQVSGNISGNAATSSSCTGNAATATSTGLLTVQSKSSDPTTSDIAASKAAVYKNTTTGLVKLWTNDGGTMKSVLLI